ncbi:MAG: hypothetical protein KDE26_16275 [Bacteroidetes bacterium]|nr:hypothetical protein [Bacteroidota bacterium]
MNKLKEWENLTADFPELSFDYLGINEAGSFINFFTIVKADGKNESEILHFINEFFEKLQNFKKDLALNRILNPNGVICFVFEAGSSYWFKKKIIEASKISHGIKTNRIVMPWVIDVVKRKVYPHENPVSVLPPVWIFHNPWWGLGISPGEDQLNAFIHNYDQWKESGDISIPPNPLPESPHYQNLVELKNKTKELISQARTHKAFIGFKSCTKPGSWVYEELDTLLFNFRLTELRRKLGKISDEEGQIQVNQINDGFLTIIEEVDEVDCWFRDA